MSGIKNMGKRQRSLGDFSTLFEILQMEADLEAADYTEEVSMPLLEPHENEETSGEPKRKRFFQSYEYSRAPSRLRNPHVMGREDETIRLMSENNTLLQKLNEKTSQNEELERKYRVQSDRLREMQVESAELKDQLGKLREEVIAEVQGDREKMEVLEKEKQKLKKQNGDLQDLLIYQHERIQGLRKEVEEKEQENTKLQGDVANSMAIVSKTLEETRKWQRELQPHSTVVKAEQELQEHQTVSKEIKPEVLKGAQLPQPPVIVLKGYSNAGFINKEGHRVQKFVLPYQSLMNLLGGHTVKNLMFAARQVT